jgi:hypothetical protein
VNVTLGRIWNFSDLHCVLSDLAFYTLRHLCTKFILIRQFQFLKRKPLQASFKRLFFYFCHILISIWHEKGGPWQQFYRFSIDLCVRVGAGKADEKVVTLEQYIRGAICIMFNSPVVSKCTTCFNKLILSVLCQENVLRILYGFQLLFS